MLLGPFDGEVDRIGLDDTLGAVLGTVEGITVGSILGLELGLVLGLAALPSNDKNLFASIVSIVDKMVVIAIDKRSIILLLNGIIVIMFAEVKLYHTKL
jgi:hypothetical protein